MVDLRTQNNTPRPTAINSPTTPGETQSSTTIPERTNKQAEVNLDSENQIQLREITPFEPSEVIIPDDSQLERNDAPTTQVIAPLPTELSPEEQQFYRERALNETLKSKGQDIENIYNKAINELKKEKNKIKQSMEHLDRQIDIYKKYNGPNKREILIKLYTLRQMLNERSNGIDSHIQSLRGERFDKRPQNLEEAEEFIQNANKAVDEAKNSGQRFARQFASTYESHYAAQNRRRQEAHETIDTLEVVQDVAKETFKIIATQLLRNVPDSLLEPAIDGMYEAIDEIMGSDDSFSEENLKRAFKKFMDKMSDELVKNLVLPGFPGSVKNAAETYLKTYINTLITTLNHEQAMEAAKKEVLKNFTGDVIQDLITAAASGALSFGLSKDPFGIGPAIQDQLRG